MLKFSEKSDPKTDTKILLDAISKDKVHLARFILDALDGKIVDEKSEGHHTPLVSSVFLQDPCARARFMNLLLQRGANVNQQDGCGRTALSHACERGFLDAVKTLVKNNADPEIMDAWGNTALMYAAAAGHALVVEFLVRAFKRLGMQVDRQNKVGNSAMHVAQYLGHAECLSALMCSSRKVHGWETAPERFDVPRPDDGVEAAEEKKAFKGSSAQNIGRKKSSSLWSRMMSMDSIEELEKDDESHRDGWQTSSQGHVLTPRLPHRCRVAQTLKHVAHSHGPAPSRPGEPPSSASSSPRLSTSLAEFSGPLSVLLTPIRAANRDDERTDSPGLGSSRFGASYYRKRCSLPTSSLSSGPPERSAMSVRMNRPRDAEDSFNTACSSLSNRLLRRFTLPELKKSSRETGARDGDGEGAPAAVPRSETFPLGTNHPQVGSKPSIDSISAVKCEFDFQHKTSRAHV